MTRFAATGSAGVAVATPVEHVDGAGTRVNLEDLYRLLRTDHVQAQGIVDTVGTPLLVLDRELRVVTANRAFFQTFQVGHDETYGRLLHELGDGQWDIPELRHLLKQVIPKSNAVVGYEVERDFPGLGRRTLLLSAGKLFHPEGTGTTLLLAIEDVTGRRRAERELALRFGELRHRVGNLFTLVQALARQTRAEGRPAEAYRADFLGRLEALMAAHELAFAAPGATDLAALVARVLEPYAPEAVTVEAGPATPLVAAQAQALALVLHEFATNAVKHGAWSVPSGRVRVGWGVEGTAAGGGPQRLRLRWREEGGSRGVPPSSPGFGTRYIELAVTHELGGRAELTFAPTGLEAEIAFPLG